VLVNGDTVFEANQTFHVILSNPSGATIADSTGVGTIKNDDKKSTTLTLRRRITRSSVIARGLLEPATTGLKVRVALLRWVNGRWVRLRRKLVTVTNLKDRDGDGKPEARYRAVFKRPAGHGRFKLRARFAGTSIQKPAKAKLRFRL